MNTEQLKQLSIVGYLLGKGLQPDKSKTSRAYTFFCSPFRSERTASFAVNNSKNTFFDYGAGFGGDIIRLVELYEKCSFLEACAKLAGTQGLEPIVPKPEKNKIEIVSIGKLSSGHLLRYLQVDRRLELQYCYAYLNEVHVLINGKRNYMVGFKNDAGGFELRNRYLKIGTSPKAITSLLVPGATYTSIFEGWPDFLSYCTLRKSLPANNVIVLNSASLVKHVCLNEQVAYFYGDNDETGTKVLQHLPATDMRHLYHGYKDLNEYLVKTKSK